MCYFLFLKNQIWIHLINRFQNNTFKISNYLFEHISFGRMNLPTEGKYFFFFLWNPKSLFNKMIFLNIYDQRKIPKKLVTLKLNFNKLSFSIYYITDTFMMITYIMKSCFKLSNNRKSMVKINLTKYFYSTIISKHYLFIFLFFKYTFKI